jgi:aldehyde dehydrogenase
LRSETDHDTVTCHFREPPGVVGQIIPWKLPILMTALKPALALAAGNCIAMKPAEQTPAAIMLLIELRADLCPAGVPNVVTGLGARAGDALVRSGRIAWIAFTGPTATGREIRETAIASLIPVTREPGGKSSGIPFADVMEQDGAGLG